MLETPDVVIRALLVYTDWWQPTTTSVIQLGSASRKGRLREEGVPYGLLETLGERAELRLRMQQLSERDREVLFLWYLQQLSVEEISRSLRISRRQCFRRRASAIRRIVELGEDRAA